VSDAKTRTHEPIEGAIIRNGSGPEAETLCRLAITTPSGDCYLLMRSGEERTLDCYKAGYHDVHMGVLVNTPELIGYMMSEGGEE